jgi:uncharacterized Fe-S cluster-containing MiaB family protein
MINAIKEFNRTCDINVLLEQPKCECYDSWLEHKNVIDYRNIPERILDILQDVKK